MFKITNFLVFITLFSISSFSLVLAEEKVRIGIKSAVIFNTLCAKCHEGECSGRLSFNTDGKAAHNHIKRYVGDMNISEGEVEEFFTLLNYMKKECRLVMPEKPLYASQNLSQFAIPSHKSYFIPLGLLKEGNYELLITINEKLHFRIELLSEQFDPTLDELICSEVEIQRLPFTIEESNKYFVRIRSRKPLHVNTFKIKKIP